MKVLVTGGKGQLGLSLKKISVQHPHIEFEFTDIQELDITNYQEINTFLTGKNFTHIINCAAYTAVDKAEEDQENARLLNALAVKFLAEVSAKLGIFLIHISTDYVFDGRNHQPYLESDQPNPSGIYAGTKEEGEKLAMEYATNLVIIRTSWLYSEFGHNFVKTIRKLAKERDELKIVSDQIGTPTYATDLANAIITIMKDPKPYAEKTVFHFSNEGQASWYDFANEIIHQSGLSCKVIPIKTIDYPLPAPRPFYSVLNKSLFINTFNIQIPHWKTSLGSCLDLLS